MDQTMLDYMGRYYSDRVYHGDYTRDRNALLTQKILTPPISRHPITERIRRWLKKPAHPIVEAVEIMQKELDERTPVSNYSPLCFPIVPESVIVRQEEIRKWHDGGGTYDRYKGNNGEVYYSNPDEGDLLQLLLHTLAPFFNTPRIGIAKHFYTRGRYNYPVPYSKLNLNDYYGELLIRPRFLTDVCVADGIGAEDTDLLEMLPIKDVGRSYISSCLIRLLTNDTDKSLPTLEQILTRKGDWDNSYVREDGSIYIYDIPANINAHFLDVDITEQYTKTRYDAVDSKARILIHAKLIVDYILSLPTEDEREFYIRYTKETVQFLSQLVADAYQSQYVQRFFPGSDLKEGLIGTSLQKQQEAARVFPQVIKKVFDDLAYVMENKNIDLGKRYKLIGQRICEDKDSTSVSLLHY